MKRPLPILLDCETGRRLGCQSFCCRLIVRLEPGETEPSGRGRAQQRCVDKDPRDGLCVHFDRDSGRCEVWERRPVVCRGYDCNRDPLLPVVLEYGFTSLLQLLRDFRRGAGKAAERVPYVDPDAAAATTRS